MDDVPVNVNSQAHSGRNARQGKAKRNKMKFIAVAVGVLVAAAILVFGGLFLYRSSTGSSIDSGKYQAVFFTNGQVYFGKLHPLNSEYMKLNDIFYLQAKTASSNPQETAANNSTDVELIKLGNEIHGPVDEMIISKSQILFFENLKSDSKVSTSIVKYKG